MSMKRTEIEDVYYDWKNGPGDKHFKSTGGVIHERFDDAIHDFAMYLHQHNYTASQINNMLRQQEAQEKATRWIKTFLFVLCLSPIHEAALSWFTNNVIGFPDFSSLQKALIFIPFVILFSVVAYCVMLPKVTAEFQYNQNALIDAALKELIQRNGDAFNTVIHLKNNRCVSVQPNAEALYAESMCSPKYYNNACTITVHENHQTVRYIIYYNQWKHFIHPYIAFHKLCKEQTGKDWGEIPIRNVKYQAIHPEILRKYSDQDKWKGIKRRIKNAILCLIHILCCIAIACIISILLISVITCVIKLLDYAI